MKQIRYVEFVKQDRTNQNGKPDQNCLTLGKLQSSKWGKIHKISSDTALRDIKDLIEKGILRQTNEGGRSVNYELVDF